MPVGDAPTNVALQDYVDARLADYRASHEREHGIERELAREARDTLSAVMSARFDSVNEFRAAMGDQASTFMPRDSFERQHAALIERTDILVKTLTQRLEVVEAQATRSAIIVGVISGNHCIKQGSLQ